MTLLEYILRAFENKKAVVTANKDLVAVHGKKLFEAAEENGVDFFFEGSVAGGIPIIRPLKECLCGNRINGVMGIINGTTNYILTAMSHGGKEFAEALEEAQRLGYAEPDPTADIEGLDAARKIAILASIAFNSPFLSRCLCGRHHQNNFIRYPIRRRAGLQGKTPGNSQGNRGGSGSTGPSCTNSQFTSPGIGI